MANAQVKYTLAPFAYIPPKGTQRKKSESEHPFRDGFQRDRDRIIHSRPFRRLEGKTQVFLNGSGDHFRTRLTHTLEVSVIARTIARRLRLNEDLTEAIAMAHDLGHTPFGHTGERALNRLLADNGGFDHNWQSLRIVDNLERKYPGMEGLNLTRAVRSGLLKHRKNGDISLDGEKLPPHLHLEGQVADVADDLAYYTHDIDDGINAGLIKNERLSELELWRLAQSQALEEGAEDDPDVLHAYTLRCLIDILVGDIIEASDAKLAEHQPRDPDDASYSPEQIVDFSRSIGDASGCLRSFLFSEVYRHENVLQLHNTLDNVLVDLFEFFCRYPDQMGAGTKARIPRFGLERSVADYIAGMTDRFALETHRNLR